MIDWQIMRKIVSKKHFMVNHKVFERIYFIIKIKSQLMKIHVLY